MDGNVGPTTHWAVTDLPPSCLSEQIERCTRRLRPPKRLSRTRAKRKKRSGSCRSRHVEPTNIIGCKPIYIPPFILLFSSASLSLSRSPFSFSLPISLTLRHCANPTPLSNPQNLEFDFHASFGSLVLKFLSEFFPRKSPIR